MGKIIKSFETFFESASDDLRGSIEKLGYKEKGNEISSGGEITKNIAKIGEFVLSEFKKLSPKTKVVVTAGNDAFHHNLSYVSRHTKGEALDFALPGSSQSEREIFSGLLDRISAGTPGFSYLDEYKRPTKYATGGHFHVSYRPNSPEISKKISAENPIKIEGLETYFGAITDLPSVVIDPELIDRLVSKLKEKNFSQSDLDKIFKK
jgi:hypothetical protein